MARPTRKIRFCNWMFLISFYPITQSGPAVPIDIVTEKVTGDVTLNPAVIQLIPDKEPLISRRYRRPWWKPTTTKRYALFLKYYDSGYQEYYDFPFVTIRPKYPVPGVEFGIQLAKAQIPPLLLKMAVGGPRRMPKPGGTFKPPHLIHIPEEIENYTHVNFHYNRREKDFEIYNQ